MVNHYTVPYEHETRIWKRIWDKSLFFSRAVLYRHHLFHKKMYRLMWTNDKTFLILVATIIAAIIYPIAGLISLGLYLTMVFLRIRKNTIYMPVFKMVWYYFLLDSLNLIYFFTFYPQTISEEYVAVKNLILNEV